MNEENPVVTTPLAPGIVEIPYGSKKHIRIIKEFDKRWRSAKAANDERSKKWEESEDT